MATKFVKLMSRLANKGGWVCKHCGTYNEGGTKCDSCRKPKG